MAELLERNQAAKKKDIADFMTIVDAKGTPFFAMVPKGDKLVNSLHSWPVDKFPEPSFDGVVDGKDIDETENMLGDVAELEGRVQIFRRVPKVSMLSEELTDAAGIGQKQAMAKSVKKSFTMLKRDIESASCSDRDSQKDNGTKAYRFRGLGTWAQSTAQTDLPVDEDYRTPAGSILTTPVDDTTEDDVNDVMESQFDQTGERKTFTFLCGTKWKRRFTAFSVYQPNVSSTVSAIRTYNQDSTKKISNNIETFEGDFGTLELMVSQFLARDQVAATRSRRAYILDMEMLEMRWNIMPRYRVLEDKGGGPRGIVEAVCALVVKNPLGLAKFASTS